VKGLEQVRNTALNKNNNKKNQEYNYRVALQVLDEDWEEG
jgi:hypothetical protein